MATFTQTPRCRGGTLLLVLLLGVSSPALSNGESAVQPQRFSIAISGGASLGAYEAGLNWAILKFGEVVGQVDLLVGGETRPFEAASFAGASAGGINSLLSGLTWCLRPESDGGLLNSSRDNFFRTVWLKPDVNRLLPESADSAIYLPDDALLSRHDLIQGARELRDQWHQPVFRPGCSARLGVTVTRVNPALLRVGEVDVQNQRFYIPFELRVDDSGRVTFSFDPNDYPRLNDPAMILIPSHADAPAFSITDDQVELAVITSAAFPLAFGRKHLHYCRLASITADAKSIDEAEGNADSSEPLVCPKGYELTDAVFADGGLFDNLPIGVARLLAEFGSDTNPMPVTYIYLDPDRTRFSVPAPESSVCQGEQLNDACETMEFGLGSESGLLLGALDTARRYELYRELTSPAWQQNLPELAYRLANVLQDSAPDATCVDELPYFSVKAKCADALRDAGRFLELAYDQSVVAVQKPFSPDKLSAAGVVSECREPHSEVRDLLKECRVDIARYRGQLLSAVAAIADRSGLTNEDLEQRLRSSGGSLRADRVIRVSSVGAPVTGTLLEAFGAFLDLKFREYDYYVGIYDAVIAAVGVRCKLQYSRSEGTGEFERCRDKLSEGLYRELIAEDARGKYVFSLLARAEFSADGALTFAYNPMPAEDRDMRIINEALDKALIAGKLSDEAKQGAFFVEREFFDHLRDENFVPTPTDAGEEPLLRRIMDDPDRWSHELVSRMTARLILLEQNAQHIIADRDPQRDYSDQSMTGIVGGASFLLRTTTHKHRTWEFAPSTAPREWWPRNLIPFEVGFEARKGDLTATWQPTYAVTSDDLVGLRGTVAFVGGIFDSADDLHNYVSLGFDYTRLIPFGYASSWGVTPVYFHYLTEREKDPRNTWGADVHLGFLANRLRLGLGVRDLGHGSDTVMFNIGLTDVPGLIYWTTR